MFRKLIVATVGFLAGNASVMDDQYNMSGSRILSTEDPNQFYL